MFSKAANSTRWIDSLEVVRLRRHAGVRKLYNSSSTSVSWTTAPWVPVDQSTTTATNNQYSTIITSIVLLLTVVGEYIYKSQVSTSSDFE